MINQQILGILRLFIFFLLLGALLLFGSFNLIETDLLSGVTLREMESRDDIDIAFVGSSVAVYHFNPEIVLEETGLTSFNVAILSSSLQGDMAMTDELFKTNSPEYIVLVLEPYTLDTAKEHLEAECRMMPFLTGFHTRFKYYMDNVKMDEMYVDRLFLQRTMYPKSLDGIRKTILTRIDAPKALEVYGDRLGSAETYIGSGFVRHSGNPDAIHNLIRNMMYREEDDGDNYYPLIGETEDFLEEYAAQVASHGAKLLIAICPNHTCHPLAEPSFVPYMQSLMKFCANHDIPCFNFQYARPEFMPCLDNYFFDVYHMDGDGADILTDAFCTVFSAWQQDEDLTTYFYTSDWMYLDSLHVLTNTWVWPNGKNHFVADSNHDRLSTPEYKFVYRSRDGSEILLRDYSTDPDIDFEMPEEGSLRVYARMVGEAQDPELYYDYPENYAYYLARHPEELQEE